jgi:hypothetical protein
MFWIMYNGMGHVFKISVQAQVMIKWKVNSQIAKMIFDYLFDILRS